MSTTFFIYFVFYCCSQEAVNRRPGNGVFRLESGFLASESVRGCISSPDAQIVVGISSIGARQRQTYITLFPESMRRATEPCAQSKGNDVYLSGCAVMLVVSE